MNKLKLLRIERCLSQTDLAFASNVPRYVISLAESGIKMPCAQHARAIANTLGVGETEIFPAQEMAQSND